jgi:hypothetical protein
LREDVFGFGVFHGGFPMAEGVEADLLDSWIPQFGGDAFSLAAIALSHCVRVGSKEFVRFFGQLDESEECGKQQPQNSAK